MITGEMVFVGKKIGICYIRFIKGRVKHSTLASIGTGQYVPEQGGQFSETHTKLLT